MSNEDIEFPEDPFLPPERYDEEIKNQNDLEDVSKFPVQMKTSNLEITDSDLDVYKLGNLEKKILINEISDCDMYLKNIHKGFKSVTSINSLIRLVGAGLGVHKHRRNVIDTIKGKGKAGSTLSFDDNGDLVS